MTPMTAKRIVNADGTVWSYRITIGAYSFILTEAEATVLADRIVTALGVDE